MDYGSKEIYINGRFLSHPMTGIPRFSYEMCLALHNLGLPFTVIAPPAILPEYAIPFKLIQYGKRKSHAWEQIDLFRFVKSHQKPLLISFSGLGPVYYKNHIATIHDVAFMRHPEWFSRGYNLVYKTMTPILAKNAKKILTVSRFSKDEIVECLKVDPQKIEVVYNALSTSVCKPVDNEQAPEERYILAVSSHDPRKNFVRIIRAFRELDIPGLKLYIVGNVSNVFSHENLNDYLNENIRILGHVSDDLLSYYYRYASLFVYPSLYEGFGIPPLEAMSHGCPALVSDIPPLKEIYGDSAFYCSPEDVDSIAQGIRTVLADNALRDSLITKGLTKAHQYSWSQSAERVLEIIKQTLK
jgi:glycosyltransferase involved in cell wall biosynthesis